MTPSPRRRSATELLFAADGAEVVSIDTRAQAIERLQEHCKLNDVTNLHAERMSAFDIGGLGQFDLVFGSYVLHHLEPFDEFAALLRSVVSVRLAPPSALSATGRIPGSRLRLDPVAEHPHALRHCTGESLSVRPVAGADVKDVTNLTRLASSGVAGGIDDLGEDRDRWCTQAEQAMPPLTDQRPAAQPTNRELCTITNVMIPWKESGGWMGWMRRDLGQMSLA